MATWAVNSYSYPNPFQERGPAQGSWDMFQSFVERHSYASVKTYWETHPGRPVSPHGVESWKAAFEQFGFLYVLSSDDNVVATPGGRQLLAAAAAGDDREFAWIGLNLLLRFPLRGTSGRRSRGAAFEQSDLLLYWFLHAARIELDGLWHSEVFRVLSQVFQRSDAQAAIDLVRHLRIQRVDMADHGDPSGGRRSGVYNVLNQVLVQGGLNHMLLTSSPEDSPYFDERENWWFLQDEFRDIVELALGGQAQPLPAGCATQASLMQRMPAAPNFSDEQSYFDYLGADVTPLAKVQAHAEANAAPLADVEGVTVFLLTEGEHFTRRDANHIVGPVHALCVLADERRVIVSDDLERTHMVEHKELAGNEVVVRLRAARPIIDRDYVEALFGGGPSV